MKSISFFSTLAMVLMATVLVAQTKTRTIPPTRVTEAKYTVLRWNDATINGKEPKNGITKFNDGEKEIKFNTDAKSKGLVLAQIKNGDVFSFTPQNGKSGPPVASTGAVGKGKDLMTMSIDEIFALINQDMNLQKNTQTDVIRADKTNNMQKVNTPNSNINLNKANTKVIRQ
jgi:hypothetical protein